MSAITFTGRQLITRSLQLIGQASAVDPVDANDMDASQAILNGLLDTLSTQRLALPYQARDVFSFTDDQASYTIGPSGSPSWTLTRPVSIDAMAVEAYTADPIYEIPMAPLNQQSYDGLTIKTQTAPYPFNWYYKPTYPNGTIIVWPVPTDSANHRAVIYAMAQLSTVTNLSTDITMPPGYYRMLYYNLAVELAPAFQTPIEAGSRIQFLADTSLNDIKRINLQPMDLQTGVPLPGTGGIYNIYSDSNYS
jgi:hypothetical protein